MDFISGVRLPSVRELGTAIAKEGGGGFAGFGTAGFAGRRIENYFFPPATNPLTETSSSLDKAKGWAANNLPKIVLWMLARGGAPDSIREKFKDGTMISVFFDSLMRLTHHGVNPATAAVDSFQLLSDKGMLSAADTAKMQELVQQNAYYQQQIASLTQALAARGGVNVQQVDMQSAMRFSPQTIRDRNQIIFGFMTADGLFVPYSGQGPVMTPPSAPGPVSPPSPVPMSAQAIPGFPAPQSPVPMAAPVPPIVDRVQTPFSFTGGAGAETGMDHFMKGMGFTNGIAIGGLATPPEMAMLNFK